MNKQMKEKIKKIGLSDKNVYGVRYRWNSFTDKLFYVQIDFVWYGRKRNRNVYYNISTSVCRSGGKNFQFVSNPKTYYYYFLFMVASDVPNEIITHTRCRNYYTKVGTVLIITPRGLSLRTMYTLCS